MTTFVLSHTQEEKEREELAGANKVSDPRKKGAKDDKTRKGEAWLLTVNAASIERTSTTDSIFL